ncbi:MAG TPA: tetratricopeptide repeat protein [Chitinophagaceae bacterium]|nr:tetratricopeptide repeat protein [Chitinophagaceae bacterium]
MKFYSTIVAALLLPALVSSQTTAREWYDKALKLKNEKKASEALAAFKEAVKLKSDYKEAIYEMGWCQNDTKDYVGAIASLTKARSLWPGTAKIHFELGYAFEKINSHDSAINNYNQCLQISDAYSSAYRQLGYIYYSKGEYETALKNFMKYQEFARSPITDYFYWYRKGYIQNALKQYDSAKAALTKSLEFKTDYTNTYCELGFASKNLKQDEDAIAWYKKANELDPKSHVPYNGIGEVYRDNKKDMNEAINWYKKTLAINPDERKANFGLGYCNNSLGNYATAAGYLQKAIQLEPAYTAAYVELGYSNYKLDNEAAALENFTKAVSLNPKNENARYYATLVYLKQSNKAMAQKMVDELKTLNSKYVTELQERVNSL